MLLVQDGRNIANVSRIGSQYIIDSIALEAAMASSDDDRDPNLDLWHRRFGHIGVQQLRGLSHVVSDLENPISIPWGYNSDYCEPCIMAKQLRVINRQAPEKVDTPLGRVFSDVWGPYSIPTLFGERYIYTCNSMPVRGNSRLCCLRYIYGVRRVQIVLNTVVFWLKWQVCKPNHTVTVDS